MRRREGDKGREKFITLTRLNQSSWLRQHSFLRPPSSQTYRSTTSYPGLTGILCFSFAELQIKLRDLSVFKVNTLPLTYNPGLIFKNDIPGLLERILGHRYIAQWQRTCLACVKSWVQFPAIKRKKGNTYLILSATLSYKYNISHQNNQETSSKPTRLCQFWINLKTLWHTQRKIRPKQTRNDEMFLVYFLQNDKLFGII